MSTTGEETPAFPEPNAGVQSTENPGFIKIDPACLKDALRMYFQPIKNDDPVVDFYTMYKRETMEYDQEYMNKCTEDLNTTLIFAGLFSAVSSAFIIAFQPGLQQDPSDRSEAYLRAILLSINPSISPDEHPATPSMWNGPPQEIVTTLDLLYASLLMSLLAAFVAMLGKQWVNRYLRHTGGSMIERCGDRQRKLDGIERWPFRAFIGSLPAMLQIALFLLTCGLSRYMWSINGSVARVIISFTLLSFLFYIGIVIAGTSSYECPFQTPASAALRALKGGGVFRRIWMKVSSSTSALSGLRQGIQRRTRTTPLPTTIGDTSGSSPTTFYATSGSPPTTFDDLSGSPPTTFDDPSGSPPTTFDDTSGSYPTPQNSSGLRVEVRDLERIQKQNVANGRCVCWVLRNVTDPEAIDFAICLAGIIRWFDGGLDCEPPFDTIVSYFMACFDSAKQLYPSLRDRAYFSARAILQIHVRAWGQPDERANRYPIPVAPSSLLLHADNDLHNLLDIFEALRDSSCIPLFPNMRIHTPAHSSWVSSLFVDLLHVSPDPPSFYRVIFGVEPSDAGHLSAAATNHPVVIANTLIVEDISLGGHIEEETFWAVDKSDSLVTILVHLSTTLAKVITRGEHPYRLSFLLQFLLAWEKRPDSLATFAFLWCCMILEAGPTPPTPYYPLITWLSDDGLLFTILKIGFRLIHPDYRIEPIFHLDYKSNIERIFRTASSSDDDEVLADALCAWIAHQIHISHCPLEMLFDKRKGVDKPFSPRLRRVSIQTIEHIWMQRHRVSEVLLECLDVKLDEMTMSKLEWQELILEAMHLSLGVSLPLHHWHLLDGLAPSGGVFTQFEDPYHVKMMKLLEKNGEWEKLEVWMGIIWQSEERPAVTLVEDIEQVTLKLLLRRPSALLRFKEIGTHLKDSCSYLDRKLLELICTLAQMKPMPFATWPLLAPSTTTHLEPTHGYRPGGSWEESGGTDNTSRGEGNQPLGSGSITTKTVMLPANQAAPPSPRATGEQLVNHNSDEPCLGPTITTTQPARAVLSDPPPVEDYPDNSAHHYPSLPSSCIPDPHDIKQNTLAGGEPVQNDKSCETTSERECVEELWLGLGRKECYDLICTVMDRVVEEMKSKHNCGCSECVERCG